MTARQKGGGERVSDLLIVATLLVMGLIEAVVAPEGTNHPAAQALLAVLYAGALAWRRRWPVPVLTLVIGIGPVLPAANSRGGVISYVFAAMLAAFTVGRHLDRPATWWGPALTVGFGWVILAATDGVLSDYVFITILYGGAWAVGYAVRQRENRIAELAGETDRLRREHAQVAARALAEERARIARELHDIVSHSISVITVQTQAVRRRLDPSQQRDIDDLRAVEITARQAMAEMRRLLGVLRAGADHELDLAPQPGLAQLSRLVSETVAAGVPVLLHVEGTPVPLPPGVDLAAYRIVQEALTNVRRHAPGARAIVIVRYAGDSVEVQVDNEGDAGVQDAAERPEVQRPAGHGLAGMTERVTLYGGTLDVGERPGQGYRVRVVLPIREAALP